MQVHMLATTHPLESQAPGVFVIANKNTQKQFVVGAQNLQEGIARHRTLLLQGKHQCHQLQLDWAKDGPLNFHFRVVEVCQGWSKEVQASRVSHWIKELGVGYNTQEPAQKHLIRYNSRPSILSWVSGMMKRRTLRNDLVSVSGSLPCATILEQVLYWHSPYKNGKSRLRVWYKGDLWLAKSRDSMMQECGLSVWQYRTAIQALVDADLIDYRIGGFAGKPTPYIRLNAVSLYAKITGEEAPFEWKPHERLSENLPNVCEETTQTNTEVVTENLTEIKALAPLQPTPQNQPSETPPEGEDVLIKNKTKAAPKSVTSTASVVAQFAGATKKDLNDVTVKGLYHIWAVTVPQHFDDIKFVSPFTRKQEGQLSKLRAMWGENAAKVLEYVLSNWVRFCKIAQAESDLKSFPLKPNIDFLLKHGGVAMNTYLNQGKGSGGGESNAINCTKKAKITFVKKAVPNQPEIVESKEVAVKPPINDEDRVPTPEEVMEMLKDVW